jgi:Ca2+ transporting ATPase
MKLD